MATLKERLDLVLDALPEDGTPIAFGYLVQKVEVEDLYRMLTILHDKELVGLVHGLGWYRKVATS